MDILKKITSKKILYFVTIVVLVLLPILKQSSFYLVRFDVIRNYDSINPAYLLYFAIPLLIFVYIKNIVKSDREFCIYDYLFFALILAGFIASLFAIDSNISWFGKEYRHEGFFTVLCYYLLFITWMVEGNKEDIKKIINIFIIMAILNSVYAIFQLYTPFRFVLRYSIDTDMVTGISGNPNFFGSLIVTVLSITTTKFLIDKKIFSWNIPIIVLLFISLINSQSSGPFITYVIVILFFIIYLLIRKKTFIKNIIYLIVILAVTLFCVLFINKQVFNIDKCEICDLVGTITKDSSDDSNNEDNYDVEDTGYNYSVSNGRIELWKESLEIVKKNPVNGVGYDNFHLAYYEGADLNAVTFINVNGQIVAVPKYYEIFDNAHNVYLQTLISAGFLGLIPYLLLCLLTFIKGLRSKCDYVIILLGGFVAYSVQAFANINVLQVAPIYYVIIGLILSIKE